ncbi:MAG TPA: hypothetical protein G4O07_00095 [Dehalococcoidia bacterium]|nr:hypothetical protein [Dehalococcoidia bacterium]
MFTSGIDMYIYVMAGFMALGVLAASSMPALVRETVAKTVSGYSTVMFAIQQPKEKEKQPFWKRKRDTTRQVRDKLDKLRSESDGNLPVEIPSGDKPGKKADVQPSGETNLELPDKESTDTDSGQARPESTGSDLLDDLTTDSVKSSDSEDYFDDDFEEENKSGDSGGGSSEKSGDTDSLFDLFATEIVEENKAGELAAGLDDLDIRDILSEAQLILNELRSMGLSGHRQQPPPL